MKRYSASDVAQVREAVFAVCGSDDLAAVAAAIACPGQVVAAVGGRDRDGRPAFGAGHGYRLGRHQRLRSYDAQGVRTEWKWSEALRGRLSMVDGHKAAIDVAVQAARAL